MPTAWSELGSVDPHALVEARRQAHRAVQWATRLARANLPAAPDDSQSNLGWDRSRRALLSRDLAAGATAGLALDPLALFVARGRTLLDEFAVEGRQDAEAGVWLDGVARRLGLKPPSGVSLPYDIPAPAGAATGSALAELARWYDAADDVLQETRSLLAAVKPGPSEVRCWPHHFDLATLLSLATGDPHTAASVGIGMSPGDDFYAQPYFYISPWPAPPAQALPDLPAPGRWHTEGFVGALATGEAVLALAQRRPGVRGFIDAAVDVSRRLLGA